MALTLSGDDGVAGVNGSATTPAIQGTDTNTGLTFGTDTVNVVTGGTTRATVDSSGRLLVGTSTARSNVVDGDGANTLTPPLQLETANDDAAKGLSVIYGRNNTNGAEIVLGKHRSASVGGTTIVSNNDQLGSLTFSGSDGTNFRPAATVEAFVDNTPGASDMPGRLTFSTTADGASSPTEAMLIDSSQNLRFNSGFGSVQTAYGVRAWVNFNGTGTVAIRGSGNVSSITDEGAGLYRVNFSSAMPDGNYAVVGSSGEDSNGTTPNHHGFRLQRQAQSSTEAEIATANTSGTPTDHQFICCLIAR